jgi:antitoxin component YwqK of YwqJK toxin-antitoxin module
MNKKINGLKEGPWEFYWAGKLWQKGQYVNNEAVGLWYHYLAFEYVNVKPHLEFHL